MIYKLGIGGLRKLGCVERNYAKAPVAQIRGGFINWEWGVCESGVGGEKLCEGAGCANKRMIYKLGMGGLRKLGVWREIMRKRRLRK